MRVADDVPLGPSPDREVLPGPVKHAMGVDDRLRLQARRQLPLRRFSGVTGRAPTELSRLNRLAYQRVILGVLTVTPQGVIAVRPAGHFPAVSGKPTHVDGSATLRRGPAPAPGLWPWEPPAERAPGQRAQQVHLISQLIRRIRSIATRRRLLPAADDADHARRTQELIRFRLCSPPGQAGQGQLRCRTRWRKRHP